MKASVSRTFLFVGVPVALALVALIYAGMEIRHFILTSPKFAVKEVEVVTSGKADEAMILERAAIPINANIFSIDLEAVRAKVEEEPWVHSSTVIRSLPNKIQIHYKPQEPKAILGAGSMYYLNQEGVPFYKLKTGDSMQFPLVQVEGRSKDREILRQRVESSLEILSKLKNSQIFAEKDLGDMTVRVDAEDGAAPYVLTLRYPPKALAGKGGQNDRLYSVSFGSEIPEPQVKRWETVVRYLVQQGKNPKLIRLELGKKVVVKVER